MSKRNNQGGAPIKFGVSENVDGHGARIPTSTSRTNWKHGGFGSISKPTTYEWIFIGLTTIIITAIITALVISDSSIQTWLLSFFLALFPIVLIIITVSRARYYSKEVKNKPSKKREKKKPKHRKDYK